MCSAALDFSWCCYAAPTRKLVVTAHFRREDAALALRLKLTLPLSWEERSLREAVVDPFVRVYDRQRPHAPASAAAPFDAVRVVYWSGPRPSRLGCHQYTRRGGEGNERFSVVAPKPRAFLTRPIAADRLRDRF